MDTVATVDSPVGPDRAATAQAKFIAAARELLRPSPVTLNRVPNWFRRAVLREFKGDRYAGTAGHAVVWRLQRAMPSLALDHWGGTTWRGRPAFVSEPYCDPDRIAAGQRLADRLGCGFEIDPNSWWYPGATTRLVWFEKEESA